MQSPQTWLFSCLFAISFATSACSSGPCGATLTASDLGMATADFGDAITYGDFTVAPNNDCPNVGSPTSLTIGGFQTGTTFAFALCVSRPEQIGDDFITIGQDTGVVRFVAASGEDNGCTLGLDRSGASTAEARFTGFCEDGLDPSGFDMEVRGTLTATRNCSGTTETVTVELAGAAPVAVEITP